MQNQIYIIYEKTRYNFKIGSTCNFYNRVGGYITCCDYFDNYTHFIELYDIIKSKYSCYQLDWICQQLSTKYSYPFVKFNGTGGKEFYKLDKFFNAIGVELKKKYNYQFNNLSQSFIFFFNISISFSNFDILLSIEFIM